LFSTGAKNKLTFNFDLAIIGKALRGIADLKNMFNFSTTTCITEASDTLCTTEQTASTSSAFINGFSYGEVIQIFLLILIFSLLFFALIKNWIFDKSPVININK
jgi:hypothetical protein